MFINALFKIKQVQHGKIVLACDKLGAVRGIQHLRIPLSTLHFDYISSIRSILTSLPIEEEFLHVNGHLDKILQIEDLSVIEQMNVAADNLAKTQNLIVLRDDHLNNLPLLGEIGPVYVPIGKAK